MKKLTFQKIDKDGNANVMMKIKLTPKERIKSLILPDKLTSDLAYFCGFMAGDGSMGYREDKKAGFIKRERQTLKVITIINS